MELKKSYKGFVWWLILYTAALLALCFLPIEDGSLITRLILSGTAAGLALLAYIIYRTEYVYWYNGTEYEDAVAAGSQRRQAFAWKHFERFAACAAVCVLYSAAAHALGWPFWIDIVLFCVALMATAVSTIRIKL